MASNDQRPNSASTATVTKFRNRQAWQMTPEQRLAAAEQLQVDATKLLMASPAGSRAFLERNLRKRRTPSSGFTTCQEFRESKDFEESAQ